MFYHFTLHLRYVTGVFFEFAFALFSGFINLHLRHLRVVSINFISASFAYFITLLILRSLRVLSISSIFACFINQLYICVICVFYNLHLQVALFPVPTLLTIPSSTMTSTSMKPIQDLAKICTWTSVLKTRIVAFWRNFTFMIGQPFSVIWDLTLDSY